MFDDLFGYVTGRWPGLFVVLVGLPYFLKIVASTEAGRALFHADLGPVHDGGTHWSVADVSMLGGGAVLLAFIIALGLRRIWAMQRDDRAD
jgi:hypothetical protein